MSTHGKKDTIDLIPTKAPRDFTGSQPVYSYTKGASGKEPKRVNGEFHGGPPSRRNDRQDIN